MGGGESGHSRFRFIIINLILSNLKAIDTLSRRRVNAKEHNPLQAFLVILTGARPGLVLSLAPQLFSKLSGTLNTCIY